MVFTRFTIHMTKDNTGEGIYFIVCRIKSLPTAIMETTYSMRWPQTIELKYNPYSLLPDRVAPTLNMHGDIVFEAYETGTDSVGSNTTPLGFGPIMATSRLLRNVRVLNPEVACSRTTGSFFTLPCNIVQ